MLDSILLFTSQAEVAALNEMRLKVNESPQTRDCRLFVLYLTPLGRPLNTLKKQHLQTVLATLELAEAIHAHPIRT